MIENIPIWMVKFILGLLFLMSMLFGMIYANNPKIKGSYKEIVLYVIMSLLSLIISKYFFQPNLM